MTDERLLPPNLRGIGVNKRRLAALIGDAQVGELGGEHDGESSVARIVRTFKEHTVSKFFKKSG